MTGLDKSLRNQWPKFVIELVVLVLGISASFVLNEWRIAIGDRESERRTLELLRADLALDSAVLATGLERIHVMMDAYDDLLAASGTGEITEARIDEAMDWAISYWAFTVTDNTYEEMKQTGSSRLVRNKELLAHVIEVYNRVYARVAEWDNINRRFVLERMIPYLDDEAPYVDQSSEAGIAVGYAPIFESLRGHDRFRNLLKTNRLFKQAQASTYEGALQAVVTAIGELDRELAAP